MKISYILATFLMSTLCLSADEKGPTKREIALIHHWLANTSEVRIHQLRGASENKMYLHKDGHREAVYDGEGKLVKDGINDGSYDYAHPSKEPLKHFSRDILPWITRGNSRTDPTIIKERLEAYSLALGEGLATAQVVPKKEFPEQEVEKSSLQVIEFFLRVLDEGEVEAVLQILEDPKFEPEDPKSIGIGLTKGLRAVVESKN